jgi:hypothetical protein
MLNFIPALLSALRGFMSNAVSAIQGNLGQASSEITKKMGSAPEITAPPPNTDTKITVGGVDENIARLDRIEKQIKAGMNSITVAHSSALCYDLIRNTYPLIGGRLGSGGTGGAQMVGEKNFKSEVEKIFQPIDRIPFGELVKRQDWVGIQEMDWKPQVPAILKMIEQRNDIGLLRVFGNSTSSEVQIINDANPDDHRRARGQNGRARGTVYVRNKQSIQTYAEMFKRRVGIMASGWWVCATRLGRPADGSASVASFVMKNYGTGRATVSNSNGKTSVSIENRMGDFNGMVTRIGGIANAVRSRTTKFNTAVAFMVRQVISRNQ